MIEAGTWPEVGGCGGLASLGCCFPGLLLAGARGCLGFWNAPFRIGGGRCRGWEERGGSPLAMGLGDRDWGLVSEGSRDGNAEIYRAESSPGMSPLAMGGCFGDRVLVLN